MLILLLISGLLGAVVSAGLVQGLGAGLWLVVAGFSLGGMLSIVLVAAMLLTRPQPRASPLLRS